MIEKLSPTLHGRKVRCFIHDTPILDAKLAYIRKNYYVCQDKWDGSICSETFGYKYSWRFGGFDNGRFSDGVKDLRLVQTDWDE